MFPLYRTDFWNDPERFSAIRDVVEIEIVQNQTEMRFVSIRASRTHF